MKVGKYMQAKWLHFLRKVKTQYALEMSPQHQRKYWLEAMLKIGHPVLNALSKHKLKSSMPLHFNAGLAEYAPLEALGRLACGMAPWLELSCLTGEEEKLRKYYLELMLNSIDAATSTDSPDYMTWGGGADPGSH